MTSLLATVALAISLLALVLLARRDPKRLRSLAGDGTAPHTRRTRELLGVVLLLPGVALMCFGYWPAFLIWLGGIIALGWAVVQMLALRR